MTLDCTQKYIWLPHIKQNVDNSGIFTLSNKEVRLPEITIQRKQVLK